MVGLKISDQIKKQLIEIEKVQIVKNKCVDDPIAIAELDAYLSSSTEELNKVISCFVLWRKCKCQLVF